MHSGGGEGSGARAGGGGGSGEPAEGFGARTEGRPGPWPCAPGSSRSGALGARWPGPAARGVPGRPSPRGLVLGGPGGPWRASRPLMTVPSTPEGEPQTAPGGFRSVARARPREARSGRQVSRRFRRGSRAARLPARPESPPWRVRAAPPVCSRGARRLRLSFAWSRRPGRLPRAGPRAPSPLRGVEAKAEVRGAVPAGTSSPPTPTASSGVP